MRICPLVPSGIEIVCTLGLADQVVGVILGAAAALLATELRPTARDYLIATPEQSLA
jgi:hypothetical protein